MTNATITIFRLLLSLALLASCGAVGCTQPLRVEQADAGEKAAVDGFLNDHLQKQSTVTVAEAYRAVLLLADGDETSQDFDARKSALESRAIARPEWHLQRAACIDRGSVAYMVCQVIRATGGVNFNVLGRLTGVGDRRYAVRELVYLEIMEPAAPYRYITGGELVDVLAKADRYMAEHGLYDQQRVDIAETLESQQSAASPALQSDK